ncbi:uncharacterized protein [Malus domestica]|uniref:uncharacterized protein n=1 Tax=Malus domestica TaxID=3750 RepID=UPI0007ED8EA4|nr:uncharacterized protein LOC108173542 [Malus domestica]
MTYVLSAMFCAEPDQPTMMEGDYLATEPMMAHVSVEEVREGESGRMELPETFKRKPERVYSDKMNVVGAGIVIVYPKGIHYYYSFLLDYQETTNNRAEYEVLIIGLEILMELGATEVEVFSDSELVINQLNGEYKCRHITIADYYLATTQLLSYWGTKISVSHIPRESNAMANEMAQLASGTQIQESKFEVEVEVQKRNLPSIFDRGFSLDVMTKELKTEDWRSSITQYLKNHYFPTSKKSRQQATKYVMWEENLLRKTPDGLLLKCLGQEESMRVMAEVHEGICGAHQARTKMRLLLRRQIYLVFSKWHTFIIVATNYFTKWIEASAVKSITSTAVKKFIETKILHIYEAPETFVTNHGPSFISKEVEEFANKFKIKMIRFSPFYPQSNGQAEASNKVLVNVIKRMVADNLEMWHERLGDTLWAYRTSKRVGIGTTPYALTFGKDVVLPMKINVSFVRIQNQFGLHSDEYIQVMCQGIEDLDVARIETLNKIQ